MGPTITCKPNGSALVLITSIVCGLQFSEMKTLVAVSFPTL